MGRYTGPKVRLSRRCGAPIADIPKHTGKELELPGMHGYRGRRNTEYGVRLTEKQKLRFHYGVLERQFRKYMDLAKRSKGNTANSMIQLLETRLDNVLRRLGVGRTIWATRQIVNRNPSVAVVILSMHKDESYVIRSLKAGARAYLLKDSAEADLIAAIGAITEGKSFFSPAPAWSLCFRRL
jgi:ribosomal protein S4